MSLNQAPQNTEADAVNGVPFRLLDGYDGGEGPPEAFLQELLRNAPPEVRARAEAFAKDRAQQQDPAPEGAQ